MLMIGIVMPDVIDVKVVNTLPAARSHGGAKEPAF